MKIFLCNLMLCIFVISWAHADDNRKEKAHSPDGVLSGVTWAKHAHQGFSMKVWISNQITLGMEAWDPFPVPIEYCGVGIGLEYPAEECIEHLFASGPIVGGIVDGVRRVSMSYEETAAQHEFVPERKDTARDRIWYTSIKDDPLYDYNFFPPRNLAASVSRSGVDDDLDGSIDEDPLDGIDNDGDFNPLTDDVGQDGIPDALETGCRGSYDPLVNPDPAFDNYDPARRDTCHPDPATGSFPFMNYKDHYTEKNGLPDHGEPHVDEDYAATSERDYYAAATDTAKSAPGAVGPQHFPMGVKINMKSYAWQTSGGEAILPFDYEFENIGANSISQVYLGYIADFDVGPLNISGYFFHNYAAFDLQTHTAYVNNSQDRGSTPIGVTLLGQSRPLDSLQFIFQWFSAGEFGNVDSLVYGKISGAEISGPLIRPDQAAETPSDARLYTSIGPFQLPPAGTITASYALVSGATIEDMLRNARRAHRLFDARYFINPTLSLIDSGGTGSVTLKWNSVQRSPFGPVTSYRIYYGMTSGLYTDSVSTTADSVIVGGLYGASDYFFAVAAFDDKGNRSALSDEVNNTPGKPDGLIAKNHQTSITLAWDAVDIPDLAGYNLYRQDSLGGPFVKLNFSLLDTTSFNDVNVWGDKTYNYSVTSVDLDGHESSRSDSVAGHLLPPSVPSRLIVGQGKTSLHLQWLANLEGDLSGYNIYRAVSPFTYIKLNSALWKSTDFIDSTVQQGIRYDYYVEAVDTTDAVSSPTPDTWGKTSSMSEGVLVIYMAGSASQYDSIIGFVDYILQGYVHKVNIGQIFDDHELAKYSTVILLYERVQQSGGGPEIWTIQGYPSGYSAYLLGGGKMLIMGRKLTFGSPPYWYEFLHDIFGVSPFTEVNSGPTFAGATGAGGFPSLAVDGNKLLSTGGRLDGVERIAGADPADVLYTYDSDPYDSLAHGKPVGVRAVHPWFGAYYMSFPLYMLDTSSAHALIAKVLTDFGEVPAGVSDNISEIPKEFNLYEAYPNPFNPATMIEYDLPEKAEVKLAVYDLLGRQIETLVEGVQAAGHYRVRWNASQSTSGVYFYRIVGVNPSSGSPRPFVATKKLLLLR